MRRHCDLALLASLTAWSILGACARNGHFAHSSLAVAEGFHSGRAPAAPADFDSLAAAGVRTIVSVDGPCPDAALAATCGMRTIHLPISYDGVSRERRLELCRAVADAREWGGVYLHCHHGKHRAPCAAAVAAIGLGWITNDAGMLLLERAGASPEYEGLFNAVRTAGRVSEDDLASVDAGFSECEPPSDMVEAMSELDDAVAGRGMSAAVAGGISETLRRLAGRDEVRAKGDGFAARLSHCESRARDLEDVWLEAGSSQARRDEALASLRSSCRDCHARHRD